MSKDIFTPIEGFGSGVTYSPNQTSLINHNPSPKEWGGPDAGYLRNREALQKRNDAYCDRISARARELGRPLTSEELAVIAKECGV